MADLMTCRKCQNFLFKISIIMQTWAETGKVVLPIFNEKGVFIVRHICGYIQQVLRLFRR